MPKPVTRWRGLPTPERRLFPSPPVAQQTPHVQHVNIFPFRRVFFLFLSVEFLHSQWPRLFFSPFFFIDSNFFLLGHKLTLYILFVYRERKKKVTSLNGFSSFFFLFFWRFHAGVDIRFCVLCVRVLPSRGSIKMMWIFPEMVPSVCPLHDVLFRRNFSK